MNRAEIVVQALLEVSKGVEQFLKSLPPSVMATFYIAKDGDQGVRASFTYRGCYLVYVNNGDGTRDFVGYIREITGAPSGVYWVTVAAYRGNGRSYDAYTGQRHDTKYQAAKLLFDIQRAGSRFTDVKKAKLHWRMSEH